MKLTQHITSRYMTAANALQSQSARRRIIAYVESYDDVLFWRTVLRQFETPQRYFEIMLPTQRSNGKGVLARGKKSAIHTLMRNTGKDMIACVDADYDYLMQGWTQSSRDVLDTPYVFHTYAYAIENLQCYAESLYDTTVMVTLNDHRVFNFAEYMKAFSIAAWPLLVWSVWLYRHGMFDIMSIQDMDRVLTPGKTTMENADATIIRTREKVRHKINWLSQEVPAAVRELPALRDELQQLGVNAENCYLFIHGHHLFEKVVLPIVSNVCDFLRKEREQEIHRLSIHRTQMSNELSCYANSIEDITAMLKKNTLYTQSEPFRRITEQLRQSFLS